MANDYKELEYENGWRGTPPTISGLPPIFGRYYYVNPSLGKKGGSGLEPYDAMDSLATAYAACSDGKGDGIVLISYGTGTTADTTSYLSTTLLWTKSDITVVGLASPVRYGKRARVTNLSTATTLTPLITISGTNNAFYNIQFTNFASDASVVNCVVVTGNRNYFENCDMFMGGGGVNVATACSLYINGAQECTFKGCTIGGDTVDQGAGVISGVISLAGGIERCWFEGCNVLSYFTGGSNVAGAIIVGSAGAGITRNVTFQKCIFENYVTGSPEGSAGCAALVVGTAPNNGIIFFHDCAEIGFTAISAFTQRVYEACGAANVTAGMIAVKSA
jgi:hypothetical protein